MAFDEILAARVRTLLAKRVGLAEKQMFGGIGFLLNGNMCCGVHEKELIVRLAAASTDEALTRPHVHAFDLAGRAMKGWVLVRPEGLNDDRALAEWVRVGADFAAQLPPKK
jgi:TfoX/Sxy family transcriptional regulator of competence genes